MNDLVFIKMLDFCRVYSLLTCMLSIFSWCLWYLHALPSAHLLGCSTSLHSSQCMDHTPGVATVFLWTLACVLHLMLSTSSMQVCRCCTGLCRRTRGSLHSSQLCHNYVWRWCLRSCSVQECCGKSYLISWNESTSKWPCRGYHSSYLSQHFLPGGDRYEYFILLNEKAVVLC